MKLSTHIAVLITATFPAQTVGQQECGSDTYVSPIGLQFGLYCGSNIIGHDIVSAPGSSLQDCMNLCSVGTPPIGEGPCQAVSYITNTSTCWFKDGNATAQTLVASTGIDTAIADITQFTTLDLACPFNDGSIQNTSNGMDFQIACRMDALGSDFSWNADPYYQPQHVESLQECMEICSDGHPLCFGVAYNPDLQRGYHNCYPKSSNISSDLSESPWVIHTAVAQLSTNSTCDSSAYTTQSGKSYARMCGQTADGPTIGNVHMSSFDECVDYCSTYTNGSQTCMTALYQASAADQYENCYLKASTQFAYAQTGWDMANLTSNATISPSSTPTASTTASTAAAGQNGDGKGSSRAWIAGAVIGPIAGVLLIVGGFFLWRRKNRKSDNVNHKEMRQGNVSYPNRSTLPELPAGQKGAESQHIGRRAELEQGDTKHEMP